MDRVRSWIQIQGELKRPHAREMFQVWKIQTNSPSSVSVQCILDGDQVAVFAIVGEIGPEVESDHDPVGGCSSRI